MLRNSLGLSNPEGLEFSSAEALLVWQRATPQLDFTTPSVRIQASKITQLLHNDRAKAVAVHDFVQSLPFGCVADFLNTRASDILRLGYGDCHTKGLLFVALVRACHVPARLRFVTLPTRFLAGLIDTGVQTMTHAVAEVYLDNRWYQTDTYVVDALLNREARELLQSKNMDLGYGVHTHGDQDWNGLDHAHAQYTTADPSSLPVVDWGVAHDPAHFYADESHAALRHTFSVRVKWMLGAQIVNRKVEQIRQKGKHFAHTGSSKTSNF
jgi:transglutaminase-like putative cysteine protease